MLQETEHSMMLETENSMTMIVNFFEDGRIRGISVEDNKGQSIIANFSLDAITSFSITDNNYEIISNINTRNTHIVRQERIGDVSIRYDILPDGSIYLT